MVTPKRSMSTEGETLHVSVVHYSCSIFPPWWRVTCRSCNHVPAKHGQPVRFAAHRQPFYWDFIYQSRIALSVGGSVWYMVRNVRCTVTIDSVLANSKTHNALLLPVGAMFRHDCHLAVKPAGTPRRLVETETLGEVLYLLICSFLLCLFWLLCSRVIRKFRRDLWITLYKESVLTAL